MKIGEKIELDGKTYEAVEEVESNDCVECDLHNKKGCTEELRGGGFIACRVNFKLVEEPWTPKNGEVVLTGEEGSPHNEVEFIGMCGDTFVCHDKLITGYAYRGWTKIRQAAPTQDPRLTEAQSENTQLKEELNDLKIKLKEILDRIERVS